MENLTAAIVMRYFSFKLNHFEINVIGETQNLQIRICTGGEIAHVSRKSYKNPAKDSVKFLGH